MRRGGAPHAGGHGRVCLPGVLFKSSCLGMGRVVVSQTCQDFPPAPGAGPRGLWKDSCILKTAEKQAVGTFLPKSGVCT